MKRQSKKINPSLLLLPIFVFIFNACSMGGTRITNATKSSIQATSTDVAVNEDDGTATVTVTLSRSPSVAVSFTYVTEDNTALAGADYTAKSGSVEFAIGETVKTFTVDILDNATVDAARAFKVNFTSTTSYLVMTTSSVNVSIVDDETPSFNVTSDVTIGEAGGNATFTVTISATANATVVYTTSNGTAAAGSDYTLTTNTLTFTSGGAVSFNVNVPITSDALDEANETFSFTLSSPSVGAQLGTNPTRTGTITDDDAAPTVLFTANPASSNAAESTASVNLAVELSTASGQTATVDYVVTGTATGGGTDYTLANGTLTFVAGDTSETITIAGIVDDALDEANETVIVTLGNYSNTAAGARTVYTYTINDNDSAPTVLFTANPASSNAAESTTPVNLAVELSAASGQTVTVDYVVTGTATGGGTDYTLADGTLTFIPGDTSETITIAGIVDDALDEPNETVILTLGNYSNTAAGARTVYTYTINDNDSGPTVLFTANPASSNAAESTATANLAVELSAASGQTVTVDYVVTGTATGGGTDYTLADGTLTFIAGDTSETIALAGIVDDALDEANETVIVTLGNYSNSSAGARTVYTYTINDNDAAPTVLFTANPASSNAAESTASANLAVELSAASGQTVTVDYVVTGTATGGGTDYTLADGTLTFIPGDTSETIALAGIVDDALDEPNETVIVTLGNYSNTAAGARTVYTYTINDNDAATTVLFTANPASSNAAESTASVNLAVELSAVSAQTVTVDYVVTGTATGGGTDYTLADGTLTFIPTDTSETITIAGIVDDALDEVNETVIVTLGNYSNAAAGARTVYTYTINDNDSAPTVLFTANPASSNAAESTASVNLAVELSAASGQTATVDYVVTGTATGGGTDYTLADGTLTFIAGDTSETIALAGIVDDALDEVNETVIVTLGNYSNTAAGARTVYTYTINDNDSAPTVLFTANPASSNAAESTASVNLAVELSAASAQTATVDYVVTGTATGGGTDYTLADGTLTFIPGDTSETIALAGIVDDALDEANETVIVTLGNYSNTAAGARTVYTYTINDNDAGPTVLFTANPASSSGAESTASVNLAVELSAASAQTVTVDYVVTGTATGGGTDYTLADGTLTFIPTDTSETIALAGIVDDALVEGSETVIVTLGNYSNGSAGARTVYTYTITDNDVPVIAFIATPTIKSNFYFSVQAEWQHPGGTRITTGSYADDAIVIEVCNAGSTVGACATAGLKGLLLGDKDVDATAGLSSYRLVYNYPADTIKLRARSSDSTYKVITGSIVVSTDGPGCHFPPCTLPSGTNTPADPFEANYADVGVSHQTRNSMVGDMDLDGNMDIVSADYERDVIHWGAGNGTFGSSQDLNSAPALPLPNVTKAVTIADFDQDGDLDVWIANEAVSAQLFLNNHIGGTTRTFTEVTITWASVDTDIIANEGIQFAIAGDLDHDGCLDIVQVGEHASSKSNRLFKGVCSGGTYNITTMSGGGAGTSVLDATAVTMPSQMAALGDIDNDGDLDIVVGNRLASSRCHVYENNGSGAFTRAADVYNVAADQCDAQGVKLADMNNDGNLDLITATNGTAGGTRALDQIYLGDGDMNFTESTVYETTNRNTKVVTLGYIGADDIFLDMVTGCDVANKTFFYKHSTATAPPAFTEAAKGNSDNQLPSNALADFNGDGKLDLVVFPKNGVTKILLGQ